MSNEQSQMASSSSSSDQKDYNCIEQTQMMALPSDLNSTVQTAVAEALSNLKKQNGPPISAFKMYLPTNKRPRDPRRPKKEISELTKEQLKNKIINIVGKKYVHQLFEGTANHKLGLDVKIPWMHTSYR